MIPKLKKSILRFNNFCLYGLGVTGKSVINYFDRENLAITYSAWDDDAAKRDLFGYHTAEKEGKRFFHKI